MGARVLSLMWIPVMALCIAPAALAGVVEICDDGIDNTGNGFTDCEDFSCSDHPACQEPVEICDDGIDNTGNGFTDCEDFSCSDHPACQEPVEICDDGIDNTGNGFTDCEDFACSDHPACQPDTEALLACPLGSAVSQPAAENTTFPGFSDESDNELRSYDDFSGLEGPITGLVWWGGGTSINPCERVADQFEVGFFQDNGTQPGASVYSENFSPTGVATGYDAGFGELLRYEVTFETPVDLASGWVSVYGVGELSGCFFYWANGANGNNLAYNSISGNVASNFAFCLITAPTEHTADQNGDGIISLSELLRVIQFFNSGGLHCANPPESTEDGFAPNLVPNAQLCLPHASDYNPQNWMISLSELLRLIQFFNSGGYDVCEDGEDGFCPL